MTENLTDEILREFIRLNIPPLPVDCETRQLRYNRESAELMRRKNLEKGAAEWLSDEKYQHSAEALQREFYHDVERIRRSPHAYRFWRPSPDDWRKLALGLLIERNPQLRPPRAEKKRGRRSGEETGALWDRAQYVARAIDALAAERGIERSAVNQSDASRRAHKLIEQAQKTGAWNHDVPLASTIEVEWHRMRIDNDQFPLPLPDWMKSHLARSGHMRTMEQAVDCLGWGSRRPINFTEFAYWADERIAPDDRLPDSVNCWESFGAHVATTSGETNESWQRLIGEFSHY